MPTLNITGYIGEWGYSKTVVQNFLDENKNKDVTIKVSSLGGDFDHALSIHNQIAKHGKVTIDFEGFNASSATIISLGAAKIKAASNSFYLIHKVSSWVDLWGSLNEDELQIEIDKLEKEKKENEKMTLVLAQMYMNKTGLSLKETFDLMKKETWLTAEEAKNLGYIDEIYEPTEKSNYLQNKAAMALIAGNGLPIPKRKEKEKNNNVKKENETADEKLAISIFNKIKTLFINNKKTKDVKKFTALCNLLKVDSIEVDAEKGAYLTEETLSAINDKLNEFDNLQTQTNELKTAKETAETAKTTAEQNLETANETIAELKKQPASNGVPAPTETDDKTDNNTPIAKGENLGEDIEAVANEYLN